MIFNVSKALRVKNHGFNIKTQSIHWFHFL